MPCNFQTHFLVKTTDHQNMVGLTSHHLHRWEHLGSQARTIVRQLHPTNGCFFQQLSTTEITQIPRPSVSVHQSQKSQVAWNHMKRMVTPSRMNRFRLATMQRSREMAWNRSLSLSLFQVCIAWKFSLKSFRSLLILNQYRNYESLSCVKCQTKICPMPVWTTPHLPPCVGMWDQKLGRLVLQLAQTLHIFSWQLRSIRKKKLKTHRKPSKTSTPQYTHHNAMKRSKGAGGLWWHCLLTNQVSSVERNYPYHPKTMLANRNESKLVLLPVATQIIFCIQLQGISPFQLILRGKISSTLPGFSLAPSIPSKWYFETIHPPFVHCQRDWEVQRFH